MPDPANPANRVPDPYYNPGFVTAPWSLHYYPGTYLYADTPIVPIAAFISSTNGMMDVNPPTGTPVIKNVTTDQVIEVRAIKDPASGKVRYENLPAEVEVNIYHYNNEERWTNFRDVVMCLCTMHATLSTRAGQADPANNDAMGALLPSTADYEQLL